ncbi:MAG: hypothetical protein EBR67_09720 [Proteobacteria bacterium]|nr:hypothetical protein [Pseudomonadota bacterium]
MQTFQEFKQSPQGGGHPQTNKGNSKKVANRATKKEQELIEAIALLRKVAPSSPEIANLEAQLASVQARIRNLNEKSNQQEAAAPMTESPAVVEISTTEEDLETFTGDELSEDSNF